MQDNEMKFPTPSNTMVALALICAVVSLVIMFKYTDKRGFWWGLGFWILGSTVGFNVGRLIEPPKQS